MKYYNLIIQIERSDYPLRNMAVGEVEATSLSDILTSVDMQVADLIDKEKMVVDNITNIKIEIGVPKARAIDN